MAYQVDDECSFLDVVVDHDFTVEVPDTEME